MPDLYNPEYLRFQALMNSQNGEPNLSSNMPPGSPAMNLGNQETFKPTNQIGTQPKISSIPNQGSPKNSEEDEMRALIDKLYPQDHAIADKFTAIWDQMPARQKPGKLQTILGIIAGAGTGNPEVGAKVINAKNDQAMGDWETKLKMLQPALTDERASNTNNRYIGSSVLQNRINQQKADTAQKGVEAKIKTDSDRTEIQKKKLELAQFIADHPEYKLVKDQKSGKMMAVNPKDPSAVPIDTGTTFDNFSELEKAQWRIKEAEAPRTVFTSGTTETIGGPDTGPDPNDEKVKRYNNAQNVYNQYPEYQKYLKLGDPGTNSFTLTDDAPDRLKTLVDVKSGDISLDPKPGKITNTSRTSISSKGNSPVKPKIGAKAPPIEQRTVGMKFTFPNGNVGQWNGTKWIPIEVKAK